MAEKRLGPGGRAQKYSAKVRETILGKLWASATEGASGGAKAWRPNFQAVMKNIEADPKLPNVSRPTLQRWWKARDKSRDAHFKSIQSKARAKFAEQGADDQLRGYLVALDQRLTGVLGAEKDWEKLPLDKRAKAVMDVARTIGLIRPMLGTGATEAQAIGGDEAADRLDDVL